MKTDTFRKGRALAAGLTLMTTVLTATAATAQGGGGFGGPPPGHNGGGFGGPNGGGGGFGGGGGRQNFRPPFAYGAIAAVDTTAGTVTINSAFGGGAPQVIKVGADVPVVTQTDTTVADLKVGDQVQVSGVPTGITASTITAGTPPAGLPGAGGFGGPRGGPGGGNAPGGGANGAPAAQGYATASGTVKTLPTTADPHLSITLGPDAQLFLKVASGAKITRYTTLKLSDLKVGDQIMAAGQTADDGTLTATTVGVNMPMARGGGFGGGFGGGGFGGGRRGNGRRGGGGGQNGGGGFGGGGFGGGGFGGGNGGPPPPAPDNGGGMTQ